MTGLTIMGLLLAGAPTAGAAVTKPRAISAPGFNVLDSAVAAGGGRTAALMAGSSGSGHQARSALLVRVGAGTALGAAQRLAPHSPSAMAIAVGADRTIAVAWTEATASGFRLRAAVAPSSGRFGAARTLVQAGGISLGGVAVTPSGRTVVAWRSGNPPALTVTPVQASIAPPGGAFSSPVTLGTSQYYPPSVATLPGGKVVLAWIQPPTAPLPPPAPAPTTNVAHLFATTLAVDETAFAPTHDLATLTSWYGGPTVEAGLGGAVISWIGTDRGIMHVSPSGGFGPVTGTPLTGFDRQDDHLGVGVEADGTDVVLARVATFAHETDETPASATVLGSVRPPGGVFSPLTPVSSSNGLAGAPRAASLPGRTFAAWGDTSKGHPARVRLAVRPAGGAWAAVGAPLAPRLNARNVRVAASTSYAAITWTQNTSASKPGGRLYLAAYRP